MKREKIQEMADQRLDEIKNMQNNLMNRWGKYLKMVEGHFQKKEGRTLEVHEKRAIAQCMENAFDRAVLSRKQRVFETTYADDISFLGVNVLRAA